MSGTNKLVQSENAEKGASQEQLAKDLMNANGIAAKEQGEDEKAEG